MREDPPDSRSGKPPSSRQKRLAEALRANLRRRKAQRRARNEGVQSGKAGPQEDVDRQ